MSQMSDFLLRVDTLIKSDTNLETADKENCVRRAVAEYSKRKPLKKTVSLTGSSTRRVNVPSDWVEEFSSYLSIEYPLNETPSSFIQHKDLRLVRTPSGIQIEFLYDYPGVNDSFYLTYIILHTITSSSSTIYGQDEEAVSLLAAAYCCEAIAAYYSQSSDSTIGADAIGYRDKAQQFTDLAEDYKKDFSSQIPKKKAGGFVNWDLITQAGTEQMFHTRDRR